MSFLSTRVQRIKPSPTLEITQQAAALKAAGKDVIGLSAGEPDFNTPDFILKAAQRAMVAGHTKYTAVGGILPLKEAVCKKFQRENGLDYTPDEILVGCGAKHILFNAFLATLNPGDEVIIPAPYWPSYPDMVEVAEGTPICIACPTFKLTPTLLEQHITARTKWVMLNSPANPSGTVYTRQELLLLADVLRRHPHVHVMSDDIYEHLLYEMPEFVTLAQVAPDLKARILTINGVSKAYAMTGWRIGYAGGPSSLIKAMTKLQSQSTSNPTSISQYAALEALEGDQTFLKERNEVFMRRRNDVVRSLNNIPGIRCDMPAGAFYVYPSCAGLIGATTPTGEVIRDDKDFAAYLLASVGVAIVPGVAFGLSPYFRISYAASDDILKEACARILKACEALVLNQA